MRSTRPWRTPPPLKVAHPMLESKDGRVWLAVEKSVLRESRTTIADAIQCGEDPEEFAKTMDRGQGHGLIVQVAPDAWCYTLLGNLVSSCGAGTCSN